MLAQIVRGKQLGGGGPAKLWAEQQDIQEKRGMGVPGNINIGLGGVQDIHETRTQ